MTPREIIAAAIAEAVNNPAQGEESQYELVPRGLWQTLHNGLNCIIHEEDNDPPDWQNAVRIARNTLKECEPMLNCLRKPPENIGS